MPAWPTAGDAQCSAGGARRGASASPSNCRRSTPAPERSLAFPRSHRLTTRAELDAVARNGKRLRTSHLEVRAVASLLHHPRVGFIIPRYKHSAVDRNQLKRRLRELTRTRLLPVLPPVDLVVRARPSAYRLDFDALAQELERASTQLRATGASS